MDFQWKPYVPVAERRRKALREMEKLKKKGHPISPVVIEGRTIASTFWGKAWCENLEGYSDFATRLPRGRTYVRNGSVVDLQVEAGQVRARVSGSEIYQVAVKVSPVPQPRWSALCKDSTGAIDSLVELLQGRFSKGVMERICQQKTGLFPSPAEIQMSCSCPDWAVMCKHVAAVLYGIGARLDQSPELLFRLRAVNEQDLVAQAGAETPLMRKPVKSQNVLEGGDLSALFGLELDEAAVLPEQQPKSAKRKRASGAKPKAKKSKKSKPTVEPKRVVQSARALGVARRSAARRPGRGLRG